MKSLIERLKVFRFQGLFFKIFFLLLVLLIVSYTLFMFVTGFMFKSDVMSKQRMDDKLQLDRIGTFLIEAHENGWNDEMVVSGLELTVPKHIRSLYVIERDTGIVRYRLEDERSPFHLDENGVHHAIANMRDGYYFNEVKLERGKSILVGQELLVPNDGAYILLTGSNMVERDIQIWNDRLLIGIGITLISGAFFAYLLTKHLTVRVRKLEEASRMIAKGHFHIEIPIYSRDELGILARSLEQMAYELDSLDRLRKEFVANVSHDMRSPLTSMHGYLEALLDGTIPLDKAPYYLKIVQEQNKRLIRLVNDLLDMAKIESGQFEMFPVPFPLVEGIRQVLARMDPQLRNHRISFYTSGIGNEVMVMADPDRMEQVLINLLQNAIEYSELSSQITVRVLADQGSQVRVEVEDQGIGIEAEHLKQIWNRFYKSDRARSRKNGTGIGLSIVKTILDQHDSHIEVRSVPQQGTVFSFTLPLQSTQLKQEDNVTADDKHNHV